MSALPQLGQSVGSFDLRMACRALPNMDVMSLTDAYVVVSEKDVVTGQWRKLGQTERVDDSLNPDFVTPVRCAYLFETVQELRFEVFDFDSPTVSEFVGQTEFVLTDVVLADSRSRTVPLKSKDGKKTRGTITVFADDAGGRRQSLTLTFAASKLDKKDWGFLMFGGSSDPFLQLSRVRDDGQVTVVAQSTVIKNNLNPSWPSITTTSAALFGNNEDALVELSVHDWNANAASVLIGSVRMPARELLSRGTWEITNAEIAKKKGSSYKNSGVVQLTAVVVKDVVDFVELLDELSINVVVAIDVTASNGDPAQPNSLHYTGTSSRNSYERAIASVCKVLEPYDSNRAFEAHFFGGCVFGQPVSHCFAVNLNDDHPEISGGTDALLKMYRKTMAKVTLSGPTFLTPVVKKAAEAAAEAKQRGSFDYYVLLIITDGVYTDREKCIDAIVSASTLPLSLIIVGVGSADFKAMEELDGDDVPLVSSRGVKTSRDIVQFVPFRDVEHQHASALAKEVLHELPGQVESYYMSIGMKPKPKTHAMQAPKPTAPDIAEAAANVELDDASSDELQAPAPQTTKASKKKKKGKKTKPATLYPALHGDDNDDDSE
jgi:hypothetical protein